MRQTCQAVDREMVGSKLNQCKVLGQNKTDRVNTFQRVLIVLVVLNVIVVHVVLVMLDMAVVHAEWCARTERCARCAKSVRCLWCARCTLCVNSTYGHDKSIVSIVFFVLIGPNVLSVIVVFVCSLCVLCSVRCCARSTHCVNPACMLLLVGAAISKKVQCVRFFFC